MPTDTTEHLQDIRKHPHMDIQVGNVYIRLQNKDHIYKIKLVHS